MSALTHRWERETDDKEMPAREQRVYRQLVGKLLWIDRADLRCSLGKTSSSLGRGSVADMRNIKLHGNNHDSAAADTQSGSGEQSSCGLSVDALGLRKGWRR